MVVVKSADRPTTAPGFSAIAWLKVSSFTSTPRSTMVHPPPSTIMATRFFPISCKSPLTVPIIKVPLVCTSPDWKNGFRWLMAALMALADISIWGTKILFSENFWPTLSIAGTSASVRILLGATPESSASLASSSAPSWPFILGGNGEFLSTLPNSTASANFAKVDSIAWNFVKGLNEGTDCKNSYYYRSNLYFIYIFWCYINWFAIFMQNKTIWRSCWRKSS